MTIHDKMLKISFVRLLTSVWANLTCMDKASDLCSLTLVFFFFFFKLPTQFISKNHDCFSKWQAKKIETNTERS